MSSRTAKEVDRVNVSVVVNYGTPQQRVTAVVPQGHDIRIAQRIREAKATGKPVVTITWGGPFANVVVDPQ